MATVYKILSPCLQECYVGSTIHKVEYRWTKHRVAKDCRSSVLFEKHGVDNCKFVVMEVCPLEEQYKKEQWWIDHSVGVVNKYSVGLKKPHNKEHDEELEEANKKAYKEYQKVYREENKKRLSAYQKVYHDENKEAYLQYQKQYREAKKNLKASE